MTIRHIALMSTAAFLVACSAATDTAETMSKTADRTIADVKTSVAGDVEMREIKFVSTDITQIKDGYGTLTGDLTIKDVTKPFTLTGTINKVGKHFRSGVDMFGVSAKGQLKRSDFGVDKYAPSADDIEIMIEVEFQKVE